MFVNELVIDFHAASMLFLMGFERCWNTIHVTFLDNIDILPNFIIVFIWTVGKLYVYTVRRLQVTCITTLTWPNFFSWRFHFSNIFSLGFKTVLKNGDVDSKFVIICSSWLLSSSFGQIDHKFLSCQIDELVHISLQSWCTIWQQRRPFATWIDVRDLSLFSIISFLPVVFNVKKVTT